MFIQFSSTLNFHNFELKQYSQERANGTFRIQSVMDRYLEHVDFDFTGLELDFFTGFDFVQKAMWNAAPASFSENRIVAPGLA